MGWKEFLEIAGVFVLSALKFGLAGVPSAVFANWSFFKVLTVTISGGMAGTLVFTFISEALIRSYKKVRQKLIESKGQPDVEQVKTKQKRKFTFTNKTIIKVKQRFGLFGLSILTPSLLSIPLGVFLAVRYYKNRKKIMSYMFISIVGWAIVLYFFYNNIYQYIFH
ncbi:MAG: hypothetical protein JNL63_07125 [Bacteroidia bacterium]|nr:hypothetical protein [Bacteroidia bacterium]